MRGPCLVATMHGKEEAIGPPLKAGLGLDCTPLLIDTDALGTFSGEVERTLEPLAAAREKCLRALAQRGGHCAVASEGSFGPHPLIPFVHGHHELLAFVYPALQIDIHVQSYTVETNFCGGAFAELAAVEALAKNAHFPSHALIIRPEPWEDQTLIFKTQVATYS